MKITNFNNFYPNVLHFHGQNKSQLPKTFEYIFDNVQVTPADSNQFAIVSTWTDAHTILTMTPNDNNRQNIVVTGSDGFIGKELVKKLKELYPTSYVYEIDKKHGMDVNHIEFLVNLHNIDIIYHLAAQTSVFNDDLDAIINDNIIAFVKLARICNERGIKLVYTSSSTANNNNTTSLYGISKRFDEDFAKIYAPYATGIRLHNVYGPKPRKDTLLWHMMNDEELILYNNGKNTRCFTYIDDAVRGIIEAGNKNGGLYNCVNPEKITIKEFVDLYGCAYTLTDKKRDKDNPDQEVDFGIPNILNKYISIKDGIKNIIENK